MKTLLRSLLVVLAVVMLGAPATWAVETVVGTVDSVETDEGTAAITILTKDGKTLVLQIDPAHLQSIKKGDQVEVTAEGKFVKSIMMKKL